MSRTVLITGASSGIGAALARHLAAQGDTVGLVARREDRLAEVLAECTPGAPDSAMWVADVGERDAGQRIIDTAWDHWGGIDVLVNNAAIPGVRPVIRATPDEVERVMDVNFHAPVRLALAVLPRMLERGSGTIMNVSSLGGRLGIPRESAYCASKFAMCGWTEAVKLDLWNTPIKVKLVIPGAVDTEIWDKPDEEGAAYDGPKVPAAEVAADMAAALDDDGFEYYLPDMKGIAVFKANDIDTYMKGSMDAIGS
ncbi:MAG: SDR family oxidoreductase [Actinobacteria bacterium]|nr:SDR family oxidoreductase [Actinomycetota bacterium]